MRTLLILPALLGVMSAVQAADVVTGQVLKVLPFVLDKQGHNAVSPSLFDRDAYQAYLRAHTDLISAMRFDVLWKASPSPDEKIRIAVELRGVGTNSVPKMTTLETNVVPGKYRRWTELPLGGMDYKNFGTVVAWRVRLWNGGELLSEQKSFLW